MLFEGETAFPLLLQEWQPDCRAGSGLEDKVKREFESRLAYSRSLLSNFSRPSLIWKFHFKDTSDCADWSSGKADYSYFLSYLFNNTAEMVDAGIVGIIYDNWMTDDGKGYGDPIAQYESSFGNSDLPTGLSNSLAEGRLDDPSSGKTHPFCELQKYSQKILGITKLTYGQKLYAYNQTCGCTECTDADYALGLCSKDADNLDDIPQLFCNDGATCAMPLGETDYNSYRCPSTCVSLEKCVQCADITAKSFCRIEESGSPPVGAAKDYGEINDDYWQWLAGLPADSKCCLQSQENNRTLIYTYISRSGSKQRSEFLQYPGRGELEMDCGNTPDTSVLEYCNIRIPLEEKQYICKKI